MTQASYTYAIARYHCLKKRRKDKRIFFFFKKEKEQICVVRDRLHGKLALLTWSSSIGLRLFVKWKKQEDKEKKDSIVQGEISGPYP